MDILIEWLGEWVIYTDEIIFANFTSDDSFAKCVSSVSYH